MPRSRQVGAPVARRTVLVASSSALFSTWATSKLPSATAGIKPVSSPQIACSGPRLVGAASSGVIGWALVTDPSTTALYRFDLIAAADGPTPLGTPTFTVPSDYWAVGLDVTFGELTIVGGQRYTVDTFSYTNLGANLTPQQRALLPPEWEPTGRETSTVLAYRPWILTIDDSGVPLGETVLRTTAPSGVVMGQIAGGTEPVRLVVRSDVEGGVRDIALASSTSAVVDETPLAIQIGHDAVYVGTGGGETAVVAVSGVTGEASAALIDAGSSQDTVTNLVLPPVAELTAATVSEDGEYVLQAETSDGVVFISAGEDIESADVMESCSSLPQDLGAPVALSGMAEPSWATLTTGGSIRIFGGDEN